MTPAPGLPFRWLPPKRAPLRSNGRQDRAGRRAPDGRGIAGCSPSPPRPFPTSLSPPPASFGNSDRSDAARTAISGYGLNPEVRGPGGHPEARRAGNFRLFSATSDAPLRSPQACGEQRRGAGRCLRSSQAVRCGGAGRRVVLVGHSLLWGYQKSRLLPFLAEWILFWDFEGRH